MRKIIVMRGIPGSGKTTWALDLIKKNPNFVRCNRDEIRSMLSGGHQQAPEELTKKIRNAIIRAALDSNRDLIIDDTHAYPQSLSKINSYLEELQNLGYKFKIEYKFMDTPLEECLKRNSLRPCPVPEKVIQDMNKALDRGAINDTAKKIEFYENLPRAILVDIDGTLAIKGNRGTYEFEKSDKDILNIKVHESVSLYQHSISKLQTVIVTGREEKFREVTERFLHNNNVVFNKMFMRTTGDNRKDSIIKEEILLEISKSYFPYLVFDDRNSTVSMWRKHGLTVFDVAGNTF